MTHLEAKKIRETADNILLCLDGLSYKDARNALRLADDELSGYSEFITEKICSHLAAELRRRRERSATEAFVRASEDFLEAQN